MTEPLLEDRLRRALAAEAQSTFPEQGPPEFIADLRRPGQQWARPLLAAAAVAAAVLGTVAVIHAGHRTAAQPTAGLHPMPSYTQLNRPRLPQPDVLQGVPEAEDVPGVQVVTPSAQEKAHPAYLFDLESPRSLPATLTANRPFGYVARFGYTAAGAKDSHPLVYSVTATNATISCPPPFIVRMGHTYLVSCVFTPGRGKSTITEQVAGSDAIDASAQTPFTAK